MLMIVVYSTGQGFSWALIASIFYLHFYCRSVRFPAVVVVVVVKQKIIVELKYPRRNYPLVAGFYPILSPEL